MAGYKHKIKTSVLIKVSLVPVRAQLYIYRQNDIFFEGLTPALIWGQVVTCVSTFIIIVSPSETSHQNLRIIICMPMCWQEIDYGNIDVYQGGHTFGN